jgi:CheY-like chemotaxis protein
MPSVLIVDDLVSIHEMLEAVIQTTGIATTFATDGEKALVRYKADKFDLVLADIDMKPMDGITLLKQLKVYDPNAVVIIGVVQRKAAPTAATIAGRRRRAPKELLPRNCSCVASIPKACNSRKR